MHAHFSEPELVELGCMIGLTLGQQSWLRLLNIEHHEVMAGTSASMAPGYEDAKRLAPTKAAPDYWAKSKVGERGLATRPACVQERAMKRSTDRILTTHAGSLPRPPDLTRMIWDMLDDKPVDQAKLAARVQEAVVEAVGKQREAGIDIICDGEMGKVGFSNYVMQRYSGFANRAQFVATDLGEFPEIITKLFVENEGGRHLVMPNVEGPIEVRDKEARSSATSPTSRRRSAARRRTTPSSPP